MERQRVIVIAPAGRPSDRADAVSSDLRAYGRAAIAAGYAPHFFLVGAQDAIAHTDYGVIQSVRAPLRSHRAVMEPLHQPAVLAGVVRALAGEAGPFLIHAFGRQAPTALALARRLRRRGAQASVVATFDTTSRRRARARLAGLSQGYPLALRLQSLAEFAVATTILHWCERRAYRSVALAMANYQSVRRNLEAEFGGGVAVRLARSATDAAFTRDGTLADRPESLAKLEPIDAPLIVSLSRHDARKGLDVLIRALARLKARGVRFRACLVGGGPLLEQHRKLVGELGLSQNTVCVGPVSDAYAYLQYADVFALPTREEGGGSAALLEAMQARTAIVASNVDGIPEDVSHEESALLVAPGDIEALAAAIERLAGEEALRGRLTEAAEASVRERHGAAAYSADLAAIYTSFGFPPAKRPVLKDSDAALPGGLPAEAPAGSPGLEVQAERAP